VSRNPGAEERDGVGIGLALGAVFGAAGGAVIGASTGDPGYWIGMGIPVGISVGLAAAALISRPTHRDRPAAPPWMEADDDWAPANPSVRFRNRSIPPRRTIRDRSR
jgi:hypothetical protein